MRESDLEWAMVRCYPCQEGAVGWGKMECHSVLTKHLSSLAKLALALKLDQENLLLVGMISTTSISFSNLLKARLCSGGAWPSLSVLRASSNVEMPHKNPRVLNKPLEVNKPLIINVALFLKIFDLNCMMVKITVISYTDGHKALLQDDTRPLS